MKVRRTLIYNGESDWIRRTLQEGKIRILTPLETGFGTITEEALEIIEEDESRVSAIGFKSPLEKEEDD